MTSAPNSKTMLPFGGSKAIDDDAVVNYLQNINFDIVQTLNDISINDRFCATYIDWLKSSKNNQIAGIENFTEICYINGTTEGFDHFYAKNNRRRFRCFKGEYVYHNLSWRNNFPGWAFIEDDEIKDNDAIVMSWPFSDTGNTHTRTIEVLNQCTELKVPVLIDCIYYSTSEVSINLNYDCITDVVFGLSKTFPVAHARIGIRLTKKDEDDPISVLKKINYNNRLGAKIGLQLIENFSCDYIFNKYRVKQIEICDYLDVDASNCVLFGIGGDPWHRYNRGGSTNRLSLHNYLNFPIDKIPSNE